MAWLASRLFQLSEREPPSSFSVPFESSGSLTTTDGLVSFAIFFPVIDVSSVGEFPQKARLWRAFLLRIHHEMRALWVHGGPCRTVGAIMPSRLAGCPAIWCRRTRPAHWPRRGSRIRA